MSAVEFAKVVDGEFERTTDGDLVWDVKKLDNWYYRRWIGDYEGGTTNQRFLDYKRAKWQTYVRKPAAAA